MSIIEIIVYIIGGPILVGSSFSVYFFVRKLFNRKHIHGYNLKKWNFLGTTSLNVNGDFNTTAFFFCKKNNPNNRSYKLTGKVNDLIYCCSFHSFILHDVTLWEIGEKELYYPVLSPSKWLQNYMLDNNNKVWDDKTKWWAKQQTFDSDHNNVVSLSGFKPKRD